MLYKKEGIRFKVSPLSYIVTRVGLKPTTFRTGI